MCSIRYVPRVFVPFAVSICAINNVHEYATCEYAWSALVPLKVDAEHTSGS